MAKRGGEKEKEEEEEEEEEIGEGGKKGWDERLTAIQRGERRREERELRGAHGNPWIPTCKK